VKYCRSKEKVYIGIKAGLRSNYFFKMRFKLIFERTGTGRFIPVELQEIGYYVGFGYLGSQEFGCMGVKGGKNEG